MNPAKIRAISICIFRRHDQILVFEGFDSVKDTHYYRALGGGIEPGERAADAVRREIREETGFDSGQIKLLGVIENIFELEGRPKHEIVFVFDGEFLDPSAYNKVHTVQEPIGAAYTAKWRSLDSFDESHRLVPDGLFELLGTA